MHPILFQIGPLKVFSYGLMLAVAVLVCSTLVAREARRRGLDPNVILDLMFWVVLGGIVGARIFYIFLDWEHFAGDPLEVFKLHHGGLAFQGGLLGGLLVGWFFLRCKKMPALPVMDLLAPYIALGHAIGRIGCFFNGCCYGKPVAWGIYFPVHEARLHPTQLYESFGLLLLFLFLRNYATRPHPAGDVFCTYLVLAALLRFANEFFRADHVEIFLGLSIFQLVSLGILAAGVYAKLYLQSRRRT